MNYKAGTALLVLLSVGLITTSVSAQSTKSKKKEKSSVSTTTTNEKTTIIIDGDQITINGKPVTEYDGERIVIGRKKAEGWAREPYVYATPRVHVSPRIARPAMPALPPMNFSYDYSWDSDNVKVAGVQKSRGQLGVVTESDKKGLKITRVLDETAAAKAGLKEGDIITSVDGKKLSDTEDLYELISEKKPGTEVDVEYLRDKKTTKQKVKLGETKSAVSRSRSFFSSPGVFGYGSGEGAMAAPRAIESFNFYGAPKLGTRIEDTEAGDGVRVLYVEEGSIAEKSGIKENDIITTIDSVTVTDTNKARNALVQAGQKQNFQIIVKRSGSPVTLDIKIPKRLNKTDL